MCRGDTGGRGINLAVDVNGTETEAAENLADVLYMDQEGSLEEG